MGCCVVAILQTTAFIYGCLTWPFYFIVQKPWKKIADHKKSKSEKVLFNREGVTTYKSTIPISKMHVEIEEKQMDTMEKVFSYAIKKNGSKRCLGSREVINEEEEMQENGKSFKKYILGDYSWKTYDEVDRLALSFSKGLREIGLQPKERVVIFAETRAEWLIAAIAAFKMNIQVVTLYATLGDDAVVHGLNETEVKYVIISHETMPKFKNILEKTPIVTHCIYLENPNLQKATDVSGFRDGVQVDSFRDIIAKGTSSSQGTSLPTRDDIAIIMYTSGSTGVPKGVLLSHGNISTAMMAFADALGTVYSKDVYVAYLPLAHVFELVCETICFMSGIPIGYSSPQRLADGSPEIKKGCKGDTTVLQPTIMAVVPLILDRIYKGIKEKVADKGPTSESIFKFCYNYKLKWYAKGYNTPIVNKIIFKKIRKRIGGKVRLMACGGAPLAPDTHEFIRTCLCLPLLQGYGLTETTACATISTIADRSTGRVGPPLRCCDIRLVDWEDGNYKVTDKPNPRGEVHIGGDNVSLGYFQLPDATKEEFYEEEGRRWFRSGDIGEIYPDGVLKIIDRKKDLVKLQAGEYVSLGKVETEMKTCPLVDNICVYGESSKMFCVALVIPVAKQLQALAEKLGRSGLSFEDLCKDTELGTAVFKELQQHGSKCKLQKFEIPGAVKLCSEEWTPDSGLVTAAFKLKRKIIQEFYQSDIDRMYA